MKQVISKTLSIFFALMLMLSLFPSEAIAASRIEYIEKIWTGGGFGDMRDKTWTTMTYKEVTKKTSELSGGTYVVKSDVTISKRLKVTSSKVKLVLCDGKTLTAKGGIYIPKGADLTILGQKGGTGTLKVQAGGGNAGIGGNKDKVGGRLVIHGVKITAKGDTNAAGIGGGNHNSGLENTYIYGGTINATGGSSGAGIGRGQQNDSKGTVTIFGGTVNANGGNYAAGIGGGEDRAGIKLYIYGGTVNARGGKHGAGIGGGEGGSGGSLTVTGGTVNATGGAQGAGIGGGEYQNGGGQGGEVTIMHGTVTANGGKDAAGIGGGKNGGGGKLTVNDGSLTATGGEYGAGIGGGNKGAGAEVTIKGGKVAARGGTGSAGIGGGYDSGQGGKVKISGGEVEALAGTFYNSKSQEHLHPAGIGGGATAGNGGDVTIEGGKVTVSTGEYGDAIGAGGGSKGHGQSAGDLTLSDSMAVRLDSGKTAGKEDRVKACRDGATRVIEEGRQPDEKVKRRITLDHLNNTIWIDADKEKAYAGETVNLTITTSWSHSARVFVKKASDRSLVEEVDLKGGYDRFNGSFTLPDYDVIVTGYQVGAGNEEDPTMDFGLFAKLEGSNIRFDYGAIPDADSYDIYAGYTGKKIKKIGTTKDNSFVISKLNGKTLEKDKIVKLYVIAMKGQSKLKKSLNLFVAGPKSKYTNVKRIKISSKNYTLKKGKTKTLKPKRVPDKKNKKYIPTRYVRKFRYSSSNKKIATVDKKGKVKGKKKGKCKIYINAANGMTLVVNIKVN